MMKSIDVFPLLILLLSSITSAQNETKPFWPQLHFGLLEYPTHEGHVSWNLAGMFPNGDPRPASTPNTTFIYTLPQDGYPYHKYEGWNTTAFFWADPSQLKDYPRGWLDIQIPASAKGMKSGIQAGTIRFEGVEFNCQRENSNLFMGGGIECRETDREFCAGYTYCQLRYMCRREKWPVDKSCVGSQAHFCYPSWDFPGA
ncbi:hypothetical protein GQ44DRAFT_741841 [Phaeosphaeriaceae sp. PMI808]|nr:hypothetical protein GQ44DRAFT_741841 [Phaeosphaeriaceae sp. PMI808]